MLYNAKQKRNDRKVHGSYYEHLFGVKPCNTVRTAADKRKSFYEDVVQIGKKEDSGYGTEDFQLVADCLKEYMEGFQNRNPNFYVFNAVLHMDEATPHLHIDYIPVGHYKRGQDVQNGIAQALKEMGYGEGKMAIARWRAAEVEVLNAICLEHGIKPLAPEKSRGTVEIPEYKEQRRQNDELKTQNAQAEAELAEKRSESEKLDQQIEEKSAQVKAILNYIPDYEKEFQVEDECEQLCRELTSLLDGKLCYYEVNDDKLVVYSCDAVSGKREKLCALPAYKIEKDASGAEIRIEFGVNSIDRIGSDTVMIYSGGTVYFFDNSFELTSRLECGSGCEFAWTDDDVYYALGKDFYRYDLSENRLYENVITEVSGKEYVNRSPSYYGYDGRLYFFDEGYICSFDPKTNSIERLTNADISMGLVLLDGVIYFSEGSDVKAYTVRTKQLRTLEKLPAVPLGAVGERLIVWSGNGYDLYTKDGEKL